VNIEASLIYHAAESADVVERMKMAGIEPGDFDDKANRRVIQFAVAHVEDHGKGCGVSAIQSVCGVDIQDPGVDASFALQQFLQRKMFRSISAAVERTSEALRKNDPDAALDVMQEFAAETVGVSAGSIPANIFSLGESVRQSYDLVKSGYMGVPLPWTSMTELTMGLWPGTATYFVARPGVGKTQVATLTALDAWKDKKRVLIISPEMSKSEIAERFFVAHSGVSASNLVRGTLSGFEEKKLFDTIDGLKGEDGLYVMDSTDDLTVNGMESAIRSLKPDLVAVDSIYMLRFKGDKSERTQRAVDWIRQSAKRNEVPFVAFHQLSRLATKDKKHGGGYDTSAIALTDQLLWDAHAVFIMEQDSDMKADRRLKFHVGKLRRGSHDGEPIEVHWDFEKMKFDEITDEEKADSCDFCDDEYDGYSVPF
jgi:replicative DNA helicase